MGTLIEIKLTFLANKKWEAPILNSSITLYPPSLWILIPIQLKRTKALFLLADYIRSISGIYYYFDFFQLPWNYIFVMQTQRELWNLANFDNFFLELVLKLFVCYIIYDRTGLDIRDGILFYDRAFIYEYCKYIFVDSHGIEIIGILLSSK